MVREGKRIGEREKVMVFVVSRIMAPKGVHILTSEPVDMLPYMAQGTLEL